MPSAYDLIARLLGTKPIVVDLAADVWVFSCGDTQAVIRPRVWLDPDDAGKILAIGETPPPSAAVPLDLASPSRVTIAEPLRSRALDAILSRGFRSLAAEATLQRPQVVFRNDSVIAPAFQGHQREALREAAARLGAYDSRFE